jgi:hypothetical protein
MSGDSVALTKYFQRRTIMTDASIAEPHRARGLHLLASKWALTAILFAAAACLANAAQPSYLRRSVLAEVDIVDRQDGRVLPVYYKDGTRWIEGTPGHEYAIRVRNDNGGRVLAVMSVDGVNVITGEIASPSQSGYVIDAHGGTEIAGWRKSMAGTAAFYFTELPDAYAARTGRPENVGVIGIALFRERTRPVAIDTPLHKMLPNNERDSPAQPSGSAAGSTATEAASKRAEMAAAPAPQLGTGHGRIESSYAQYTSFERETSVPNETIVIRYDRRDNLVALGILPGPVVARRIDPFPAAPRFAPDPPSR